MSRLPFLVPWPVEGFRARGKMDASVLSPSIARVAEVVDTVTQPRAQDLRPPHFQCSSQRTVTFFRWAHTSAAAVARVEPEATADMIELDERTKLGLQAMPGSPHN